MSAAPWWEEGLYDEYDDQRADAENENRQARLDQEAEDHPTATY